MDLLSLLAETMKSPYKMPRETVLQMMEQEQINSLWKGHKSLHHILAKLFVSGIFMLIAGVMIFKIHVFSSERLSMGGMTYFLAFLTVVLLALGCFQLWLLFTTKAEDQFIALGEKHVFFVLDKMQGAFCFPVNEIKAIHLVPNGNAQSLQQRITNWFLEPEANLDNFLVEAEKGKAFMGNDFIHIKLDSLANEVFRHRYAFMLY